MASTYVNDLRLEEMATGDQSGTWGDTTNTNLELIAEAFSYGTEASFGSDADATTTIADGASDPARSLYLKITSSVSLTATRTLTIAPNTVSKIWIIENATSGSQSINISQGSGANVTIPNGDVKVIYTDGAGAGAAVVDAFTDLNLSGTTIVAALDAGSGAITTTGTVTGGTLAGTLSTAAQTNITSVGALDGGSITSGFGSIDVGSSAITTTGTVTGNTLAGTLSTAAQPNITSLGTLTGLDVAGTPTFDGLTVSTSSPSGTVASLKGSSGFGFTFSSDATSPYVQSIGVGGGEEIAIKSGGTKLALFQDGGDISFYDDTGTSQALFWDASAESLGIGTTSPDGILKAVSGSSPNAAQILIGYNSTSENYFDANTQIFRNGSFAEKMRIDSSGNVMVGKTGLDASVAGTEIRPNLTTITSAGDTPLYLRRNTNDGEIINFKKDGTTVGSIGALSGDLTIGTGDTGLGFLDGGNFIQPHNITTNAVRDAAIDLGTTSGRFKDLYLSGGAYLGGTGAANHLDDYEEGTFTPTLTGSSSNPTVTYNTQTGIYTKIGNLVHIEIRLVTSSVSGGSGNLTITGLPFASSNFGGVAGAMTKAFVFGWATDPEVFSTSGSTVINIYSSDAANTQAQVSHLNTGAGPTNYTTISGAYLI